MRCPVYLGGSRFGCVKLVVRTVLAGTLWITIRLSVWLPLQWSVAGLHDRRVCFPVLTGVGYQLTIPSMYFGYQLVIPSTYFEYQLMIPFMYFGYQLMIPSLYFGYPLMMYYGYQLSMYFGYQLMIPSMYVGYFDNLQCRYWREYSWPLKNSQFSVRLF